jgi:ketosteroid isomerase-like protein
MVKLLGVLLAGLLLGGSVAGQEQVQTPSPAPTPALPAAVVLPPELARVLRDYEAAWRVGDGAALSRLFAEDGFVLPNGAPPVRGRDAVRAYYKGPGGPLVLHAYAYAYAEEGRVGYIVGGFSRAGDRPDIGKFTLTLKKVPDGSARGRWLIFSDMDNGNQPPRPWSAPTPTPTQASPPPSAR